MNKSLENSVVATIHSVKVVVITAVLPFAAHSIQGTYQLVFIISLFKPLTCCSLKNPAKYVGRKPRKYTVPVPVAVDANSERSVGNITSGVSGVGRASGRGPGGRANVPGGGVEPIAAQAAAAAQVRTYRDNGIKHSSSSYNRVCREL